MSAKSMTAERERQHRADAKRAGKRTRAWACIVYPESAPEGWIDALRDTHQEILISPIHDSDVTATGEPKKAHYHVMALWSSPASESQARSLFELCGVTGAPEMVRNAKGYARYLVHLDDHDKHRYSEFEVTCLGGADWAKLADDTDNQTDRTLCEIEDWIDEFNVTSYRALCRYARKERPDWVRIVRTHTIHLSSYLRSVQWELNNE